MMLVKHHNRTQQPLQAECTIDQLEDWAVLSWLDLNHVASLVTDGELGAKAQELNPFTHVEKSSIMKYDLVTIQLQVGSTGIVRGVFPLAMGVASDK